MNEFNSNKQGPEQLRIENEIRKLKLQLEFGAGFHNPDPHSTIPPHIEKIFLDQIEKFERAHQESHPIRIYDYIGNPQFRKAHSLKESEIHFELQRIKEILLNNFISCDTIYDTDMRDLYVFITEELFDKEIDNVRIPGMVLHFIYEEFHPNHECSIEERCYEFIHGFLAVDKEDTIFDIEHEEKNKIAITNFRESFSRFELNEIQTESITVNDNKAEAVIQVNFSGGLDGSGTMEHFSGFARFSLEYVFSSWYLTKVLLPGMKMS